MNNQHLHTLLKIKTLLLLIFFSVNLSAQDYQVKADSLYEEEIYDEAFDYYELALEDPSSNNRNQLEERKDFCLEISMPLSDFENEKYDNALKRLDKSKFTDSSGKANFLIGKIYLGGLGETPKDISQAVSYLKKADKLGHSTAASLIPDNFSVKEADDLLEKGDVDNALNIYTDFLSKNPDDETIFAAKEKCLSLIGARKQFRVANYQKAFAVFNKYKDNALSFYYLGLMYKDGSGVGADNCDAIKYLTKAKDLGFKQANGSLSNVPVCKKSNFEKYKDEGDESFSLGKFELAEGLYALAQDEWEGTEPNEYILSQISLAKNLTNGVAKYDADDFDSAMSIFETNLTNKYASYYMAEMYYEGKGVKEDEKLAIDLAKQALPLKLAKNLLEEIRKKGKASKSNRKYKDANIAYNLFNLNRSISLLEEAIAVDYDSITLLAKPKLDSLKIIQEGVNSYREKDYKKANELLSKYENEAIPAYCLGMIYADSLGTDFHLVKAQKFLTISSNRGYDLPNRRLSEIELYLDDQRRKKEKYQKLVSTGDELYRIGVFSEAKKNFKKASEIIPENKVILINKFKNADLANRGKITYIEEKYAQSYNYLKNITKDSITPAIVWFYLGRMEYEGNGTTQNKIEGKIKLEKACAKGYPTACDFLEEAQKTRKMKFNEKHTKVWFGIKGGYGFTRMMSDTDLPDGISADFDPGNAFSYQAGITLRFGNHAVSLDLESLYGERIYISNYQRSYIESGGASINYEGTNTIKIQSISNYALISLHLSNGFAIQGGGFYNANLNATQTQKFTVRTNFGTSQSTVNIDRDYELLPDNSNANVNLETGDYGVSAGLLMRTGLFNIGARYDFGLAPFFEENDFNYDLKWSQHNVMVYMGLYLKYKKRK